MRATIEVSAIRARPALVPLRRALNTRVGRFTVAPMLLIDLETKSGIVGRVLAMTFIALGLKLVPRVLDELVAAVAGRKIAYEDLPAVHDDCQKRLSHLGHEGVTQMALSMFDMALYDATAREAGVSLYALLGGTPEPIATYNSCGLGLMDAVAAAREAKDLLAEHGGFSHLKLRMGRTSVVDEIAVYKAVRSAVGPQALISVDFNQGLPAASALETCRAIDGLGLVWIEEPIVYDDYDTHARLARKLATPIQIGENVWSWRVGKAAIERGACDYIMPDLLRIGGITGWMRLAHVAHGQGVPVSSHLSPDVSAHVLAATPTRHWLEFMDWGQDLILDPLVPFKGWTHLRDTPGAGIEWNEAAVAKCLVSV
jgi:mandelate racemase